jgi:hypothetical protein
MNGATSVAELSYMATSHGHFARAPLQLKPGSNYLFWRGEIPAQLRRNRTYGILMHWTPLSGVFEDTL